MRTTSIKDTKHKMGTNFFANKADKSKAFGPACLRVCDDLGIPLVCVAVQ